MCSKIPVKGMNGTGNEADGRKVPQKKGRTNGHVGRKKSSGLLESARSGIMFGWFLTPSAFQVDLILINGRLLTVAIKW